MKLLLLISICFTWTLGERLLAQAHIMTNGNISTCSGTFYDPGGTANYGNNANFTMTICPSTLGTRVILNFNAFNVENGSDFMTIYDGATVAAPSLGVYTGITGPGLVSATSGNATGCITIRFTSNGANNTFGWEAAVSCASPCQEVIAGITATPVPTAGQFIDVCPGDLVTLDGSPTNYPNNNASYAQSNATSTFSWNYGDGNVGAGINASHVYSVPGIYQLKLRVNDVAGCTNSNDIQTLVRVAARPVFAGSSVTQPTICLGEANTLTGAVIPQEIDMDCTPPVSGLTYLPDGTGASYNTSINVDCYSGGSTLTNINQLEDICLNMEHSYAGDLTIQIKCPNGTTVDLVTYGGMGNQFVGQPVDNTVAGLNGVGYNYCFSPLGNQTWLELVNGGAPLYTYVDNGGNNVNNHAYIPAGTYEPSGNLGTLVGCPLNGAWTIVVIDNLGQDDGYIFDWNINFSNTLTPAASVYTPPITSSAWVPNPTITATAGNTITVVPVATGNTCYTFSATDEFGCVNDTSICFTVLAPGSPGCPACLITNFTANSDLGNCQDEYVTTGTVQFVMPPVSGTLIVEDCQGNQVIAANAPFISPVNYTLTGTDADGAPCFFRAYFSDNMTCTSEIAFTYPASNLPDEAGTVTATLNGTSINDYIVCNGDNVSITSNDDWIIPPLAPGNDPGLGYPSTAVRQHREA
jgi:subtilisin-like proprotein convertase family protein